MGNWGDFTPISGVITLLIASSFHHPKNLLLSSQDMRFEPCLGDPVHLKRGCVSMTSRCAKTNSFHRYFDTPKRFLNLYLTIIMVSISSSKVTWQIPITKKPNMPASKKSSNVGNPSNLSQGSPSLWGMALQINILKFLAPFIYPVKWILEVL